MLAVEPFIDPQHYVKHNNNCSQGAASLGVEIRRQQSLGPGSGFVNPLSRNTPQAFTHFSWEYTKHLLMVVDIQGVGDDREAAEYELRIAFLEMILVCVKVRPLSKLWV